MNLEQLVSDCLDWQDPLDETYPGNPGEYASVAREVAARMSIASYTTLDQIDTVLSQALINHFDDSEHVRGPILSSSRSVLRAINGFSRFDTRGAFDSIVSLRTNQRIRLLQRLSDQYCAVLDDVNFRDSTLYSTCEMFLSQSLTDENYARLREGIIFERDVHRDPQDPDVFFLSGVALIGLTRLPGLNGVMMNYLDPYLLTRVIECLICYSDFACLRQPHWSGWTVENEIDHHQKAPIASRIQGLANLVEQVLWFLGEKFFNLFVCIFGLSYFETTLTVTEDHEFLTRSKGFRQARLLATAGVLVSLGGGQVTASAMDLDRGVVGDAYDLTVEVDHNYLVGEDQVVAHNTNCGEPGTSDLPGPSRRAAIKDAGLPANGPIRFVPSKTWNPSERLRMDRDRGGYTDKFGNIWKKGPGRGGDDFEWDVQLSRQGKQQLGRFSRSGEHINVSKDGKITH